MASEWFVIGFREIGPVLDPKKPALHWATITAQAPLSVYKNWYNVFQVFLKDVGLILSDLQTILLSAEYKPTDKTTAPAVFKAGEALYQASHQFVTTYRSTSLTKEHALSHLATTRVLLSNLNSALDAMLAASTTNILKKNTIQDYNVKIKKYADLIPGSTSQLGSFDQVKSTDLISTLAVMS
jgi:hypothetical protein